MFEQISQPRIKTRGQHRSLLDDLPFDHAWVFDHLIPMGRDRTGDIFEGWTVLAAMAASTSRIRLGTLVTGVGYRHPALFAKMAATVDHVSGGRLEVGIGAGGDPVADEMAGLPSLSPRERVERLDETARVLRRLWDEESVSFAGKHFRLTDARSDPKPVQRPLPLWIASNGERRGMRTVAERATGWLTATFDTEPGDLARLLRVLDRHCEAVGRDPSTLRRGVQFPLPATDDEALRACSDFASAGFTDLILMPRDRELRTVERAAGLISKLQIGGSVVVVGE
ncbi:LLM class flavin-dependent oxidoreductase [Actinoplanes sp. CA-030573]|uniref:LLM class flavin-dependent oxidoreductase n=1 Tax=Actinoplanes sp. CA-030573 TaxID=3239898 RepID=UPI003D8EFDDB